MTQHKQAKAANARTPPLPHGLALFTHAKIQKAVRLFNSEPRPTPMADRLGDEWASAESDD